MATNTDLIQQLYVAYFNRPADVAGLNYWTNALTNGGKIADIAKSFSQQTEYTSLFAGKQPDEIVNIIYTNLFGRGAEQAGLNYWGAKLQAGAVSVADVVLQVAAGATGTDLAAYNNKVAASAAFTTELNTAGNEAERVAYASGTTAALNVAKAWLSTVTTDASLVTAKASVHDTAQSVVVAATPVVNAVLTNGVDNLVGGAGNEVYNAAFNGAGDTATTWSPLDTIDGKGGVNTINLSATVDNVDLSVATVTNVQKLVVTGIGGLAGDAADVSGWTGLTNATFSLKGGAVQSVTVADTTALTITNDDGVTVEGGSSINVTAGAGAVTATTNAALKSATIVGGTTVAITDASDDADQLTTVSLKGNTGAATLIGNALTTVSIANTNQDTTITNTEDHTLTLNLVKLTGGNITDAGATAVKLNTTTTKSTGVTLTAAAAETVTINAAVETGLTSLAAGDATSVVITGAGKVTVAAHTLDADAVIDASAATGSIKFTSAIGTDQKYIGGTGSDTITVNGNSTAITTGAGADTVTVGAALGADGTVDAGDGTDILSGTATVISGLAAAAAAKFTNFETLKISDILSAGDSFDVSAFSGVTNFIAAAGVTSGDTATVTNLGAAATVTLAGDLTTADGTLSIGTKTDGTADVVNLIIKGDFLGDNDTSAEHVGAGDATVTITASTKIETLNVTSTGNNTLSATQVAGYKGDFVINTLDLTDASLVNLNVTGDSAFSYASKAGNTKLVSIDASALTQGATIDATLGTAGVSIKGSLVAANDLTGGAGKDTIVGGAKADTITGGAKGDTLTGGGGNDTFKFVASDSSIGTGAFDTITDFNANTVGNGTDGKADGTGAVTDVTKLKGSVLSFVWSGDGSGGLIVDVLGSAADATTFLANNKGTNVTVAALDSANHNLYVDNTGDGVADFFIKLNGVNTIDTAAFVIHA
jgi:S-layer protein